MQISKTFQGSNIKDILLIFTMLHSKHFIALKLLLKSKIEMESNL